ncbi:hypothetical protein F5141DRAFT_651112 [Pisolithus sp. B1]|nr:hypothetical protein F5141DRAFT_651112 [Pisolithus sp. B1]
MLSHPRMLPFANPFARVFQSDLVTMLLSLDYPNFIGRSLQSTRVDNETDLDRWNDFWNVFQANIGNISLLATVLLSGNLSFLSIVAQDGLSYLPQRLSYASLFAALGSIFVGLAVRTPRFLHQRSNAADCCSRFYHGFRDHKPLFVLAHHGALRGKAGSL